MLVGRAVEEPAVQLDEVGALADHLHGEHPVGEAAEPVELERAGHELGEDGQALLGPGRARVPDGEEGEVGLGLPVERRRHVDEGLVVQQLGGVAPGEHGVTAHLDPAGGGRRVRRELVDDEDLGCGVAEDLGEAGPQVAGHLLAGAVPHRRRQESDRGEVGDRVDHLLGEGQRRRRVETEGLGRDAVQLAAVGVERRRAHGRQHQRGGLDRGGLAVEPGVDGGTGTQQPPGGGDGVEDRRRIHGPVHGLGQAGAAGGEELAAQLAGPAERRQHPQRPGGVVQDRRRGPVPLVRVVARLAHGAIIPRTRPEQDGDRHDGDSADHGPAVRRGGRPRQPRPEPVPRRRRPRRPGRPVPPRGAAPPPPPPPGGPRLARRRAPRPDGGDRRPQPAGAAQPHPAGRGRADHREAPRIRGHGGVGVRRPRPARHVAPVRGAGLARAAPADRQVPVHLPLRPGGVRPAVPGVDDRQPDQDAAEVRLAGARRAVPVRADLPGHR